MQKDKKKTRNMDDPTKNRKKIQIRTKKKSKIKQKKIDKKHNGKQQTSLEIIDSPRDCCRHNNLLLCKQQQATSSNTNDRVP